ncbi:MAG: hypothetical protein IJS32_05645 [Kiritimatiellae bacterium]|nr:hypothetical protein [Kiritimatiellia bacterium]
MRFFRHLGDESKRLAREESGAALLLTLAVFLLLFVICCGVFAIGETIRQKTELQNACDAAAYSAAVAQADVLSRMAVVNRSMAWTYIQLCRAQMDYIVFRWLKLTYERFKEDRENNVLPGDLFDFRYCFVPEALKLKYITKTAELSCGLIPLIPVFECQECHHDLAFRRRDKEEPANERTGPGWYIGLPNAPGGVDGREIYRVRLNENPDWLPNIFGDIGGPVIDGRDNGGIEGGRGGSAGTLWQREQEERIAFLKDTLRQLNAALMALQMEMLPSITSSAEEVLKAHLPKKPDGTEDGEAAEDFYFLLGGGVCEAGPKEYFDTTNAPGYFKGLCNTEEDELQFLSMAGGVPSRRADAPAWMQERPVLLSDWFGAGDNPTETTADGIRRFTAGGLDQWYVRAGASECRNSSARVVTNMPCALDSTNTPGGIRRVYKNHNRKEGGTWKGFQTYYRPNHVFSGDIRAIKDMDFGEYLAFVHPRVMAGRLAEAVGGEEAEIVTEVAALVLEGATGIGAAIDLTLESLAKELLAQVKGRIADAMEEFFGEIIAQASTSVLDIAPSASNQRRQYWDQCENVNETVALVAEYEWASAYWFCFYWEKAKFNRWGIFRRYKKIQGTDRHLRLPIREILGCWEHGYGKFLTWIVPELKSLWSGGMPRGDYRPCFIGLDGTRDARYNTHLRGYARVYGDDAEIFNELGYIGEPACPWLLDESFFHGDGTIFVGFARRQRNPFLRAFGSLLGTVEKPGFYSPFGLDGRNGGERYLVALSAARAAFSPRPAGGDGTGSVNDGTKGGPGKYDIAYDGVLDKKMHLHPWKSIPGTRFGCACGDEENTERLARGWNLSQTDWDATLLPFRFAMSRHTPFDSFRPQPLSWDVDEQGANGTSKLLDILGKMHWNRLVGEPDRRSSDEILSFPADGSADGEGLYDLLYRRKLL